MAHTRRTFLGSGLALGLLSGCSGPGPSLKAVVKPADAPPLEFIALNRMAFGPRPEDLDRLRAMPGAKAEERLDAYIEEQLSPGTLDDSDCDRRLKARGFVTLGKSLEQLWQDHEVEVVHGDAEKAEEWQDLPYREAVEATLLRGAYSRRQLAEVLTDFWHNHFNVSASQDGVNSTFIDYDQRVIRPHVLGNFREMLEAVARSPQMLYYLNNAENSVEGPNENFARELLELHTLGVQSYLGVRDPHGVARDAHGVAVGYVDNDVYEVARCFTGWSVDDDRGTFSYYRPWHDRFNKMVLGRYLRNDQDDMQDGRAVLDLLAAHPETARHVCLKLCRRLIADDPPLEVVDKAALVFRRAWREPDQLRQVVAVILRSRQFRQTWGGKVKRPLEFALSVWRALGLQMARVPEELVEAYDAMGQPLFDHTAPDGYPDRRQAWSGTTCMLHRWRLVRSLLSQEWADEGVELNLSTATPPGLDPRALIEHWTTRLLGRPHRATLDLLAPTFVGQLRVSSRALSRLVELILMGPEFQLR